MHPYFGMLLDFNFPLVSVVQGSCDMIIFVVFLNFIFHSYKLDIFFLQIWNTTENVLGLFFTDPEVNESVDIYLNAVELYGCCGLEECCNNPQKEIMSGTIL
jgi:hypothetical protein